MSKDDSVVALEYNLEKLELYNCWASSRWEYAY